ncbi:MAG: hypothetical protein AAB777_02220, partial [Patescibacteria group bacterium]
PVSGISSATMEYKDENGNGRWYSFDNDGRIDREHGLIFLGHEHLDKVGRLFLDYRDGTKAIYDLATGQERPTVQTQPGYFDPSVDGVRTIRVSAGIETKTFITVGPDDDVIDIITDSNSPTWVILDYIPHAPTAIYWIDTAAFVNNPLSEWNDLSKVDVFQFDLEAGRDILLRFEREAPSGDTIPVSPGGGKG